jgi:hypothetical protein
MKKWLLYLVVATVLAWMGWQIKERFFVSEETRVRRLVSAMATMVEKVEIKSLGDSIADDYTSDQVADKTTLLNAIRLFRLQYAQMFIYLSDENIEMAPDQQTAEVTLVAKIVATARGGGGNTEFNSERIRLFLRKTSDGWKMYKTESPKLNFD